MREIILIFFLTTSNNVYAWNDIDKSSFFNACFRGMTSDGTIPQTTATRYCNCSTNMISRLWTVKEMEDMIKKGKWGASNQELQGISEWCLTGDY